MEQYEYSPDISSEDEGESSYGHSTIPLPEESATSHAGGWPGRRSKRIRPSDDRGHNITRGVRYGSLLSGRKDSDPLNPALVEGPSEPKQGDQKLDAGASRTTPKAHDGIGSESGSEIRGMGSQRAGMALHTGLIGFQDDLDDAKDGVSSDSSLGIVRTNLLVQKSVEGHARRTVEEAIRSDYGVLWLAKDDPRSFRALVTRLLRPGSTSPYPGHGPKFKPRRWYVTVEDKRREYEYEFDKDSLVSVYIHNISPTFGSGFRYSVHLSKDELSARHQRFKRPQRQITFLRPLYDQTGMRRNWDAAFWFPDPPMEKDDPLERYQERSRNFMNEQFPFLFPEAKTEDRFVLVSPEHLATRKIFNVSMKNDVLDQDLQQEVSVSLQKREGPPLYFSIEFASLALSGLPLAAPGRVPFLEEEIGQRDEGSDPSSASIGRTAQIAADVSESESAEPVVLGEVEKELAELDLRSPLKRLVVGPEAEQRMIERERELGLTLDELTEPPVVEHVEEEEVEESGVEFPAQPLVPDVPTTEHATPPVSGSIGTESRDEKTPWDTGFPRIVLGGRGNFSTLYPRIPTASEYYAMLRDLKYAEAELLGREFSCRVCQKPLDSQDSQVAKQHYQQHNSGEFCPKCGETWSGLTTVDKIFHVDGHYLGNSSQPKGNQPKGDRAEGDHSKDDQLKDNQSKSNQAKGVIKSSPRDASRRRRLRRNERHDRMRRLPHVAAEEESERGRPAEKLPTFECFFCHIVFKDRGMALDEIMNHYKVHFREHAASKRAAEDGSAVNPAKRQKPTGSEEERHCPRCWSSVEALGGEGRAFHKNSCFVLGEWVVLPAHAGRLKRAAYLDDKSAKQETIERGRRSKAHCSRCFRLFDLATTQEKDAHRTECGSLYQPWVYLDLREGRKRRALFLASEDNYDCIPEDEGPNGTSPVVSERFGAQLHCPVCYTYVQRMDEKARYAHGLKCGVSGPWYKTTIEYGRQRRLELGLEEGQTCPICFLDVAKKDYEWKKLHKIHCGGARRKWLYLKPEEANAKREHYLMMKEAQRDFVRRYCDWCYTCVHSLGKIKEQKHLRDCDAQSVMLSKGTAEGLRAHFLGKASTQDGINEDDGIKSSISGQADAGISGSESSETRASRERAVYGEPVGPSSDEDLALEEPESPGVAPQPSQLPTPSDLTSPRNAKLGGDDSADVDGGEGEEGEDDGTNPGEGGTKLQQFPDPVREVTSWELSDSDSNGSLPSRDWRPMMSLSKEELYKKAGLLHLLKKGEEVKGKGRA